MNEKEKIADVLTSYKKGDIDLESAIDCMIGIINECTP